MPETPVCSIIVPNYNHSIYLEERLQSIFDQTFQDYELILLDDASDDDSAHILEKYLKHPKVSHCIVNNKNTGNPFSQWNKGISLASGKYIWIAESDDFCKSTFLEKLLDPHYNDPDLALTFCQSFRANSNGNVTGSWITHTNTFKENSFREDFIMNGNKFIEKFLIHKNVIPNVSGVVFNKEKLEKIVPLDYEPFMRYNADWLYYLQLLCNSKIGFAAEPLNFFRYHESSVIAKAKDESGWGKIFVMELQLRIKMLDHLKKCKPSNYKKILHQYKMGNNQLKFLITKDLLEKGNYKTGIFYALPHPPVMKKLIQFFIKKV